MTKERVLCLHGYGQDAVTFRGRIGALRRAFKSTVEFVCLDAPFQVPSTTALNAHGHRKWFDGLVVSDHLSGHSLLVEESVAYIAAVVTKDGPFAGIFGFSQGGTMASVVLHRQVSRLDVPFAFRFAVFVSAGAWNDHGEDMADIKMDLPSLHVIGETDAVVELQSSLALKDLFVNAKVLLHPGGHYLPTNKETKDAFRAFFKELQQAHENNNQCCHSLFSASTRIARERGGKASPFKNPRLLFGPNSKKVIQPENSQRLGPAFITWNSSQLCRVDEGDKAVSRNELYALIHSYVRHRPTRQSIPASVPPDTIDGFDPSISASLYAKPAMHLSFVHCSVYISAHMYVVNDPECLEISIPIFVGVLVTQQGRTIHTPPHKEFARNKYR